MHQKVVEHTRVIISTSVSNGVSFAEATIVANIHPYVFVGKGSARRNPQDKNNKAVGEALAISRAIQAVNKKLARAANGFVKHADDMTRYKARQLELAQLKQIPKAKPKKSKAKELKSSS